MVVWWSSQDRAKFVSLETGERFQRFDRSRETRETSSIKDEFEQWMENDLLEYNVLGPMQPSRSQDTGEGVVTDLDILTRPLRSPPHDSIIFYRLNKPSTYFSLAFNNSIIPHDRFGTETDSRLESPRRRRTSRARHEEDSLPRFPADSVLVFSHSTCSR